MGTIDSIKLSLSEVPVRSVMSAEVVGIVPQAPLEVALRLMVQTRVRHLPVVGDGECLGVVDEAQVLWHLWSTGDSRSDTVGSIVVPARYPSVDVSATVTQAAALMADRFVDAVIVTEAGQLAGILTVTDILRAAARP